MPPANPPSQPETGAPGWLAGPRGRRLIAEVQRMAIPELTRVFGSYGLYLRPSASEPLELSGNMLANVVCLHRDGPRLAGEMVCRDDELPVCTGSLSLVYVLFVLESSEEPLALLQETARVLKPEGTALVITLNPWSPALLRLSPAPGRIGAGALERHAIEAGLEVIRRQYLGPFWPGARDTGEATIATGWLDSFRAASLLVLRHREAGLTPLRKSPATVSLRPGMSAG